MNVENGNELRAPSSVPVHKVARVAQDGEDGNVLGEGVHINPLTGEVLQLASLTDAELVEHLSALEQDYASVRQALYAVRGEILTRMQRDGARLRLTPRAKLRVHYESRVRDRRLVERLYELCPESLRDRCFRFDIRPLKSGLNELAKLGSEWQERVDALYDQVPVLKVEWVEMQEPDASRLGEVPF